MVLVPTFALACHQSARPATRLFRQTAGWEEALLWQVPTLLFYFSHSASSIWHSPWALGLRGKVKVRSCFYEAWPGRGCACVQIHLANRLKAVECPEGGEVMHLPQGSLGTSRGLWKAVQS